MALTEGSRLDVVASFTDGMVRLDRFTRTQGLFLDDASHQHAMIAGPWTPGGFVAAAFRHRSWAVAGYYDGTSRFRHDFTTGNRVVTGFVIPRGSNPFVITTGTTTSTARVNLNRIGGAWALQDGPLSLGVSLEAAQLSVAVRSTSQLSNVSGGDLIPTGRRDFTEVDELSGDSWRPALSVSGRWFMRPNMPLSIVWHYSPAHEITLTTPDRSNLELFNVPDVFAFGVGRTIHVLTAAAELRIVNYDVLRYSRIRLPDIDSGPIQMTGYDVEPRAGAQVRLPGGNSRRVVISGGVAREAPEGLIADSPSSSNSASKLRWRTLPTSVVRVSGGVGFEAAGTAVSVAISRTNEGQRIVATLGQHFQ